LFKDLPCTHTRIASLDEASAVRFCRMVNNSSRLQNSSFLCVHTQRKVAGEDGVDSSAEATNTSFPTLKWFRYLLLTPDCLGSARGRCFGDGESDLLHANNASKIRLYVLQMHHEQKATQRIACELTRRVFGVARVLQGWTAVGLDCGDMPVHVYFKHKFSFVFTRRESCQSVNTRCVESQSKRSH